MYEYVIIGGGLHGTCLANYLLTEADYTHEEIRIAEPHEQLLTSFATKARQCGMQTLRSPFVHHIDTEPFSLESFAEGVGRENELVSAENHPKRPTLDLFLDHAKYVIDRCNIGDCHVRVRVMDITEHRGSLRVETDNGVLDARRVVLAIGLGPQPTYPHWTTSLLDDAQLTHVWDDVFDLTTAATFDGQTFVVGGGITAAQLAYRLSKTSSVTLVSRHELETAFIEADPHWINWQYIKKRLHTLPAGSQARQDRIREARNDATVPPYVEKRVTAACNYSALNVRIDEITYTRMIDGGLLVQFADGTVAEDAQIILATGLDPASEHPLVSRIAGSLGLQRGENGLPVLDDRTLAWQRTDGLNSSVYVSGALAENTVGPLARNIIGARRVAQRLINI